MNPYIIIAVMLAIAGAGFEGFRLGEDHVKAVKDEQVIAEQAMVDKASQAAAQAISKIQITNQTIKTEVQHEIQTKLIYTDCRNTPDGLRLINEALSGGSAPVSYSLLPKTDATK